MSAGLLFALVRTLLMLGAGLYGVGSGVLDRGSFVERMSGFVATRSRALNATSSFHERRVSDVKAREESNGKNHLDSPRCC